MRHIGSIYRNPLVRRSFAGNLPETDNAHIPTSGERHPPRGCGRKSVANYSGRKFCNGFPASPQNPVFMSRFAHLHIIHPEPKHLKNFARNSQWSRGKKVRNIAFFSRFHRPGLERLLACHDACHLTRAIGHHIDRLACCSVTIMDRLQLRLSDDALEQPRNHVSSSFATPVDAYFTLAMLSEL